MRAWKPGKQVIIGASVCAPAITDFTRPYARTAVGDFLIADDQRIRCLGSLQRPLRADDAGEGDWVHLPEPSGLKPASSKDIDHSLDMDQDAGGQTSCKAEIISKEEYIHYVHGVSCIDVIRQIRSISPFGRCATILLLDLSIPYCCSHPEIQPLI